MNTHETTATLIAALLPGEWSIRPVRKDNNNTGSYLTRADGLTLLFRPSYSERGKYRCSWDAPKIDSRYGNGYSVYDNGTRLGIPSISMSMEKSSEAIAKDIARRLLPDCERIEPLARAFIAGVAESFRRQDATREALAFITGYTPPAHSPDRIALNFRGNLDRGYGDAIISAGGNVSFDLRSIPPDKALKLAEFLKDLFQS